MIELDWTPPRKKLRDFALLLGLICVSWGIRVAWHSGAFHSHITIGWNAAWRVPIALVVAGAATSAIGILAPLMLRPLYVGWLLIAYPISWMISNVLLAATYFLVFTSIATIFRLMRRDELGRSTDPKASTYWRERDAQPVTSSYFKQF